ncbi:MurR/RpiR family transcriptional regulator [Scopulibacillus cellulosilyticus]|uniref:MurR/RpiR family transcriptional regulator n=1 Tax=Scopulibacillus cellulosilyticus TaxID=2665665 RepID=A0ABW2PYJ8_9BACL
MVQERCMSRIRLAYQGFSEKERKVADYILENPQEMINSSINEVAEILNVAEATVFRFCKKIGFKGFQALKIALASEVVSPINDIHEAISEEDNEIEVAEKVFLSNIQTLEGTQQILQNTSFSKAVASLYKAKKIEFYGNGGSGVIALDAYHKFVRSGIPCAAYYDSHFQLMAASQLTKEDVAVFISHSGNNRDLLEVLSIAKETGCKTLGITSFKKSLLSQNVDIVLYTISQETEYRSEALASRIAQLSLIDALFVNIMKERKDEGVNALQKIRRAISLKKL